MQWLWKGNLAMNQHTAPCGHSGTPIIGTFVKCNTPGCDGLPKPAPTRVVIQWRCPDCLTLDTEYFDTDPFAGTVMWHCLPHGHVFEVLDLDADTIDEDAA